MIIRIIFRNLVYKPLGTILSILLLMFGVGIISMLLVVYRQAEDKFNNDLKDIDLVVGAKGSPLQLVLSAVYHIDAPTGNILRSDAEKIIHDPLIEQAIPLAYGDSYKTYPIVGTDSSFLKMYGAAFRQGNIFSKTLDAVVGSNVALAGNLKPGDLFLGTHGMGARGHVHKEFQYKVVGILQPSGSVLDNLVLTNIATVWTIHHHHHDNDGDDDDNTAGTAPTPAGAATTPPAASSVTTKSATPPSASITPSPLTTSPGHATTGPTITPRSHAVPDTTPTDTVKPEDELTALLIKFRSPMGLMTLPRIINETTNMQAASPALEINRLFDLMGIGITTMQAIAFAIMLISGLSVFISLYGRLQERKYELALARSMGSSRLRLFSMVLAEGVCLSLAGFMAGFLLSRLGLHLLDSYAAGNYHIGLQKQGFTAEEGWLLLMTFGIGVTASLIPAIKAFRLNISKTLAHD